MNNSSDFSIRFDGSNHDIDASVLGLTALNLTYLVNEIAKQYPEMSDPALKISALRPGSFVIDFQIAIDAITALVTTSNLEIISTLIGSIKGAFEIKKLLKGDKPTEVKKISDGIKGTIEITAPDGSYLRVPTGSSVVFTPDADRKVAEIAKALSTHAPDRGMEIISNDGILSLTPSDISDVAIYQEFAEPDSSERQSHQRVLLPIQTVVFYGNAAWRFRYGKRSISASIKDESFLNALRMGQQSYKSGDKLDVDLVTHVKLSPTGEVLKETYSIDKVYGVQPQSLPPQQMSIF